MGAEAKQPLDFPQPMDFVWGKLILRSVFDLSLIAIFYLMGVYLHIWGWISLFGLFFSWVIVLLLLIGYKTVIPPLILESQHQGMRYLQSEDYDRALESFKRFYAVYDQHPHRERLHKLLMLNYGVDGYREIALMNQAHVYLQLGKISEAVRCYEQCLTIHPDSHAAISSLNFIGALTGGETRPEPYVMPFWQYARGRHPASRWQEFLTYFIFLFLIFCCSVLIFSGMRWLGKAWESNLSGWVVGLIVAVVVGVLLILIRLAAAQALLANFYQGERLYSQHQYDASIYAYQKQITFLQENPWVDEWRWVFLPNSGPYSYQEWALHRMAYGYVQLGEGDRLLPLYEQMLDLNPRNGLAQTNINFIKLFRGEEGSL